MLAMAALNESIRIDPESSQAFLWVAALLVGGERRPHKSVLADLNKAIELNPEIRTGVLLSRGACTPRCMGKLDEALSDLNTSVRLQREDPSAYRTRACRLCIKSRLRKSPGRPECGLTARALTMLKLPSCVQAWRR